MTNASYWSGAVLVPESTDAAMQREVLEIPGRYKKYGIAPDAEIHGYPLWNATHDWKPLACEPRLRVDAMHRALRTVRRHGARVVFTGLDRTADPALGTLNAARARAVDRLLDCIEKHCSADGLDERCLLMFDEETSHHRGGEPDPRAQKARDSLTGLYASEILCDPAP